MNERDMESGVIDGKNYGEFLKTKIISADAVGFDVPESALNRKLFDFQRDIVRWAIRRGRAAIFADCGLGKTPCQLEWAKQINVHTERDALILAPLAVSEQTKREGIKFGIPVSVCRTATDLKRGINIANYERLHHFKPDRFGAIVVDESSILKGFDGAMRKQITDFASVIPYRLACTATPAPNDILEITNHSEFLGIMSGKEIIGLFFRADGNTTHKWRLKGHAELDFWKWLATWAVALRKPSDLSYDDGEFILPPLHTNEMVIDVDAPDGMLFPLEAQTMDERRAARKSTVMHRVKVIANMVNGSNEPWILWCNLNAEADALKSLIPDSVDVRGSDTIEHKENSMLDFSLGKIRVLISKPRIAGHGLNWQHCRNMAFVGLSDSFEELYQATRRCWRFGQTRAVNSYIVIAKTEGAVLHNIQRKEKAASEMFDNIVKHMSIYSIGRTARKEMEYKQNHWSGKNWELYLGDSAEMLNQIESDSIGLSVFSPPFPGMYAYTNSNRDLGNSKSIDQMIEHFRFIIAGNKLFRATMPGRSCCVHLTQIPAFKGTDGYIGIKDFRGEVIRLMESEGWIYYGEVCIDKDPQVKAIRTKDRGLLFKTLSKDASLLHPALADYLLQFQKPGENPQPIRAGISKRYNNAQGWITSEEWIEWARPVWYGARKDFPGGIKETDVLQFREAREHNDEKHICPLQLGVIERSIKLWSNPGDLVCSPFAGIGSEGYVAVKLGRRFVGIELKESYAQLATRHLERAASEMRVGILL